MNPQKQIEEYKKVLAAQVQKRHEEDMAAIRYDLKEEIVKELKDYIDEIVKSKF